MTPLTFDEYQSAARATAVYPDLGSNLSYPALGLASEAGEVAGVVKRIYRDHGGMLTDESREKIKMEISDCLWYCAALASEISTKLGDVASANLAKLQSRKERDVLHGTGDNR